MRDTLAILVPLAPFIILGLFVWLALRKAGNASEEVLKFGRQSTTRTDDLAATIKENNLLLRQINERLDRLEKRGE